MTQEEKQLLLIDLCARLPYGVKVKFKNIIQPQRLHWSYISDEEDWDLPKPYLRPMLSMTEEEREEANKLWDIITKTRNDLHYLYTDFLLSNHIDYRGLIPMCLALEAPEDMYKTE